jgi:DNA-binding MarR family transcriptional regulator
MDSLMDPADDLLNPIHCVSHNLQKTARLVAGVYAEELRRCGLSRGQFPILQHLEASGGGVAMSVLAQGLYMDRTTLTRNLSPLERAGLVVREADPGDARVRRVAITEAGRARLVAGREAWRRAQAMTLERIGADAWRLLEVDLRRVRKALS